MSVRLGKRTEIWEIVIFSGYNDFSYAREALRYGVVDYVLKPVDPEEFSKTLSRVIENIRTREEEKEQRERQIDYLIKYFFIEYLYASNTENVDKLEELTAGGCILSRCVRMILVSASNGFFETDEEHFTGALKDQIQREFYYVNLNSNESLLLFTEKYADYRALADTLHQFFLQQFETDCYFAVSEPVESWKDMPEEVPQAGKASGRAVLSARTACVCNGGTRREYTESGRRRLRDHGTDQQ